MMERLRRNVGVMAAAIVSVGGVAATAAAEENSDYVPRSEYEQLRADFDAMRLRLEGLEDKLPDQQAMEEYRQFVQRDAARRSRGEKLDEQVRSLFDARTEKAYFTDVDEMDPSSIKSDTLIQIGQYSDLGLFMGLDTVGRVQAFEQDDVVIGGVPAGALDPGFQTAFGNLQFLGRIPEKFDIYFDLYIASRPHSSQMYGHEGYMLFYDAPGALGDIAPIDKLFDYVNVKVGAFDVDFGDQNYRRSNNATVQRNPFIGNYLVDPNTTEMGAEIYAKPGGAIGWLVGVGSGTSTENFSDNGGFSFHGKLWAEPLEGVRTSASAYIADQSGSTSASTNLYSSNRSGGPYGAVFGGGTAPGQVFIGSGKDVTALQGDVTVNTWPIEAYAHVGWTEDADSNGPLAGTLTDTWFYGAADAVYHITPAIYVGGRYSIAFADEIDGVSSEGWVDRIQVGGGYWVTRSILAKIEYVYEKYHNFDAGAGRVGGVDAGSNPEFSGLISEVSFQF